MVHVFVQGATRLERLRPMLYPLPPQLRHTRPHVLALSELTCVSRLFCPLPSPIALVLILILVFVLVLAPPRVFLDAAVALSRSSQHEGELPQADLASDV